VVAATAAVTAASEVPPPTIPATVDQAVVVEIPDNDAPPPGWGQWEPPRACGGGTGDARRRLHDAVVADARH
jgi:hypothetical protein